MKHYFCILSMLVSTMVVAAADYVLVWNQDFTGNTIDTQTWNIEVNGDGGGNNELQYYCEKGVSLGVEPSTGKHCLILTAVKEDYNGRHCTSGRVNTKEKTYFTYGKIEARIKFPNTANGLWPAFWMLGNNYPKVGWPRCGETDIVEMGNSSAMKSGTQDRYFNGAMHVGSAWNSVWQDAQANTWPYSLQDTFHIFTCEWTPTSVTMYVDKAAHPENKPYFTAKLEPNDNDDYNRQLVWSKPSFVIFNLAVGGNFPGIKDITKITALSSGVARMYVDWLRIYQRGDAGETFSSTVGSDPIESENVTYLEMVQDASSNVSQKIIRNGQLLIIRNNHVYNLQSQIVE